MDFFSPRAARSPDHINAIKAQVVAALRLLEEATVMVTELACTEEGCLSVETVIAISQTATQKDSIQNPPQSERNHNARDSGNVRAATQFIFGEEAWQQQQLA